jgi:hypothetical protein
MGRQFVSFSHWLCGLLARLSFSFFCLESFQPLRTIRKSDPCRL